MAKEYVFLDEWDVETPQEAVFEALADARTYPEWWKPVYIEVEGDEAPGDGVTTKQHFKGKLPYTLRTTSTITAFDPPTHFQVEVVGDLTGTGKWTVTPNGDDRVHVRFDWIVHADRPLLRYLTPILRPIFRWNHNWSAARAEEGLEPYARAHASGASTTAK
ncbi:MAG TPA: SRPBCC family protein [Solirubrobacterales bacterium]|nr:SRPBCC family protein [Solirubrobacterales bacterium]